MSEKWKSFTNAEVIHNCMPPGKEWEVLEYFAENNYSIFIRLINVRVINSHFSRKKVVEHYKDANLDELPDHLKAYIIRSREIFADCRKRGQELGRLISEKSEARSRSFFDDKGKLIQFFELADNIPFSSKEDYFFVANLFMRSGLNSTAFCAKYQIDDVDGFKEAMRRVGKNDPEFGAYYELVSTNAQKAYIAHCRKTIAEVANGTMSVAEMIENHTDSRNFEKLVSLANSLFEDKTILDKFISAVINYYMSRTFSYDESLDPENLKKMLSTKEVTFILNSEAAKNLKAGLNINPIHHFKQILIPYKNKIKSIDLNRVFNNSSTGLGFKFKAYSCLFKRRSYLKDDPHQMLPNGSLVPITNDVIDMAECFAAQNNLFKGHGTIIRINRSILNGKLDYSAETKAYKESLISQVQTDIAECKTLTEYFALRDSIQKKGDE